VDWQNLWMAEGNEIDPTVKLLDDAIRQHQGVAAVDSATACLDLFDYLDDVIRDDQETLVDTTRRIGFASFPDSEQSSPHDQIGRIIIYRPQVLDDFLESRRGVERASRSRGRMSRALFRDAFPRAQETKGPVCSPACWAEV
jgi:hypothetical protein